MSALAGHRRPRYLAAGAGLVGASLLLAACGGSAAAGGNVAATASPKASHSGGKVRPGAAGTIAAVSAGSIELQNPVSGQVTVTYGGSTVFSTVQASSLSAVAAGQCVQVTPARKSAASSGAVTAAAVTTSTAVNSSCGAIHGGGRKSARVAGTVTATSGSTITVAVPAHGTVAAASRTVSTTSTTRFTRIAGGSATDLVVGQCATAAGKPDSTGTVSATRIAVSGPGASGCTHGGRGGKKSATASASATHA